MTDMIIYFHLKPWRRSNSALRIWRRSLQVTLDLGIILSSILISTAAKRLLCKALKAVYNLEPRGINVDKNAAYPQAIDELREKKAGIPF